LKPSRGLFGEKKVCRSKINEPVYTRDRMDDQISCKDDTFGRFVNDIEAVTSKEYFDWSAYIPEQEGKSA